MHSSIQQVIVIPSYNETQALPLFINQLAAGLGPSDAVMVMDDSNWEVAKELETLCKDAVSGFKANFFFFNHDGKSGRGSAIRRGFKKSVELFPDLRFVLECDADGSHRAIDVLNVKNSDSPSDLLIGSRYLAGSKIIGWPLSRRVFSFILNALIPKFLGIEVKDITNGLRRYSLPAVAVLLAEDQSNKGFIYLSEQALLVRNADLTISEIPIEFIDRTLGSSTVTWREILDSMRGIISLLSRNHQD